MRKIFFGARGLRSGWRLAIFVGIYAAILFGWGWVAAKVPLFASLGNRPVLDPVGLGYTKTQGLIEVLIATWVMARIERRRFSSYGIPARNAFGRDFWVGCGWGIGSTTLLVALIGAFGGYRIVALAVH